MDTIYLFCSLQLLLALTISPWVTDRGILSKLGNREEGSRPGGEVFHLPLLIVPPSELCTMQGKKAENTEKGKVTDLSELIPLSHIHKEGPC